MAKKKHTPEEIINKLREAEVVIAAGSTVAVAAPVAGVSSDPSLMTDYSLREDAAEADAPVRSMVLQNRRERCHQGDPTARPDDDP